METGSQIKEVMSHSSLQVEKNTQHRKQVRDNFEQQRKAMSFVYTLPQKTFANVFKSLFGVKKKTAVGIY